MYPKPQKKSTSDSGAHGVARVISKRGFCSRSNAEKLVQSGAVTLRGKVVLNPDTPAYPNDIILVNGKSIDETSKIFFAMNKPRGFVTTAHDEKGRKTVMDLFREQYAKNHSGARLPHISPVGRLDAASEGLLFFTNDTDFANQILDPKTHLDKIYRVQVKPKDSNISPKKLVQKMKEGLTVPPRIYGEPPELMQAKEALIFKESEKTLWLEITLSEGKNREIRRMCEACGYQVLRLVRVQIGTYKLGNLATGAIKEIKDYKISLFISSP
ncbi:MAG: rRNA pseudouridine synthase [Fibrobacteraceae bacterium]|nr:rRNA pseudouridine synthase [Fibrobacteraceae bacterium]